VNRIGVTGGIGSGKSLVCDVFSRLGIPVYKADEKAGYIMEHSPHIRAKLTALFGEVVYNKEKLNRPLLAQVIFSDSVMRDKVNRIIHPVIFEDFLVWQKNFEDKPYVIQEAAIIFESGADRFLDAVINVYAPVKVRISWLMERDGLSEEDIRARMHSQMSEKERGRRATFIINNDGNHLVLPQVLRIHDKLLQYAKK